MQSGAKSCTHWPPRAALTHPLAVVGWEALLHPANQRAERQTLQAAPAAQPAARQVANTQAKARGTTQPDLDKRRHDCFADFHGKDSTANVLYMPLVPTASMYTWSCTTCGSQALSHTWAARLLREPSLAPPEWAWPSAACCCCDCCCGCCML